LSVAAVSLKKKVIAKDPQGKLTQSVKPRNPAELQKIQQIVAAAVGLDTTRGDLLTVENIAFDEAPMEITEPTWMDKIGPGVRDTGKVVAVIAICLFAFLFVLRPMVRKTLALSQTEVRVSGPTQLSAATGGSKAPQSPLRTIAEVE